MLIPSHGKRVGVQIAFRREKVAPPTQALLLNIRGRKFSFRETTQRAPGCLTLLIHWSHCRCVVQLPARFRRTILVRGDDALDSEFDQRNRSFLRCQCDGSFLALRKRVKVLLQQEGDLLRFLAPVRRSPFTNERPKCYDCDRRDAESSETAHHVACRCCNSFFISIPFLA